jgi:uncharacterized membrane protein YagU involved in acid resistance
VEDQIHACGGNGVRVGRGVAVGLGVFVGARSGRCVGGLVKIGRGVLVPPPSVGRCVGASVTPPPSKLQARVASRIVKSTTRIFFHLRSPSVCIVIYLDPTLSLHKNISIGKGIRVSTFS